ncbi:MAG: hypothetical protein HWQ43_07345 [Nostoc sp. JL31]|uniref:hypothetical protein n=1 Tax=Nostoc sp. JL31 TaxID=2815395 RepID=UPI0025E02810|nr:hypothetical protein [Nostoc sp. JL31]MBN3888985.1 hypothetical protein [Nostoc sp. JL31]
MFLGLGAIAKLDYIVTSKTTPQPCQLLPKSPTASDNSQDVYSVTKLQNPRHTP